ncbi:hypothetical protein AWM75_00055 [Aerococcus urinaehominis]|uniref:Uncharacterized protein n=1 Tax=Aerococcus urinaehominis TaxID=128944 RepID=A0A0X8FJY0_9LACT|nr:DUF6198 family protein [Aerococcus urinaehominis]AMB98479.1 hypothetical protein AWM75_00055 [Aerococcus urinaehominis]SDL81495.1 Uncharacterized membrane protein YczE [Aerococcus urinaehominis]
MNKKQVLAWLLAIALMALGVSLVAQAGLGATAVTSLAYVLNQAWGWSFALLNFWQNLLLVLGQILIRGRAFPKFQWLQFFVAGFLSLMIDLWSWLLAGLVPTNWVLSLTMVVLASLFMALGARLQIYAQGPFNPAEGIVYAISQATNWTYGRVKLAFDWTIVGLALVISYWQFGQIIGVGLGTLLSAVLIGVFADGLKRLV